MNIVFVQFRYSTGTPNQVADAIGCTNTVQSYKFFAR